MGFWTHITGILPVWSLDVPFNKNHPKYENATSTVNMSVGAFVSEMKYQKKIFPIGGEICVGEDSIDVEIELPKKPDGILVDVVVGDDIAYLVFHGDIEEWVSDKEIREWWGKLVAFVNGREHKPYLSVAYNAGKDSFVLTGKDAIYEDYMV